MLDYLTQECVPSQKRLALISFGVTEIEHDRSCVHCINSNWTAFVIGVGTFGRIVKEFGAVTQWNEPPAIVLAVLGTRLLEVEERTN